MIFAGSRHEPGVPADRAVVIPFGVPDDGRGLGLGLAALVHSFAQIGGQSVALAQLLARHPLPSRSDESDVDSIDDGADDAADEDGHIRSMGEPAPVEAFVPPRAWHDLTGNSTEPTGVSFVVTGSFEPPTDGRGLIHLLVFEAKDGRTRARVEAQVDGENAGQALFGALNELWSQLGGEIAMMRGIGDLSWEALESVLRAERCALHDPLRGGPHDRLAAMAHLGRAIGDAPSARFPASRLASIALDVATGFPSDRKLAEAALRALVRATNDAPSNADLLEAIAALTLRVGDGEEAEARVLEALGVAPERPRLYALLSEARRARGELAGALSAIEEGLLHGTTDPLLNTERGIVLAARGHHDQAEHAWRMVLDAYPDQVYPPAFTNLAALVMERRDAVEAARLVDEVLVRMPAHPEVLKGAIQLSLAAEPEGVARAARVGKLATALVDAAPKDPWASLVLARALAKTGDKLAAVRRFALVEEIAPSSVLAAEAQRARFALEEPQAALEIDAVVRAAYEADVQDLEAIANRARRLALLHASWSAYFSVGIAERRLCRWRAARDAFAEAIRVCPGCTPAHLEIVSAHVALSDPQSALAHARKAYELDGESARTMAVFATAFLAADMRDEALVAIDRSLELDASDEANRALAERIRTGPARINALTRLRESFVRWRRR